MRTNIDILHGIRTRNYRGPYPLNKRK